MLNFVPDPVAAVREMVRVTQPGGKVAAYVWDYGGGMEMLRQIWDAAISQILGLGRDPLPGAAAGCAQALGGDQLPGRLDV
jgi:hypothetical protein